MAAAASAAADAAVGAGRGERRQAAPYVSPHLLQHQAATPPYHHHHHQRQHHQHQPGISASATPGGYPGGSSQQQLVAAQQPLVPFEALSLLDGKWEFDSAGAAKVLSDSGGDFRVVGVLGSQGVGKSLLLNALLYDAVSGPGAAAAAAAMPPFAVAAAAPTQHPSSRQQQQPPSSSSSGRSGYSHCTSRLDLRVHPGDRTLLLDTPPLWSASWVSELASSPEAPLMRSAGPTSSSPTIIPRAIADARSRGLPSLPAEGLAELLELQLGALLLAVCHVVVLMVDAVDEPRLWEYLQVVDMVAHCLPDVAVAAGASGSATGAAGAAALPGGPRRVAELVVVLCGVDGDALTVRHLRPQAELLRLALTSTRLLSGPGSGSADHAINILRHLGGGGAHGSAREAPAAAAALAAEGNTAGGEQQQQKAKATGPGGAVAGGGVLHFWALPRGWLRAASSQPYNDGTNTLPYDHNPPPPPALLPPLRSALLSLPRRPLAPGSWASSRAAPAAGGVGGLSHAPQLLQQQQQHMSERDWLRGVERLWACELQQCPPLERYYLASQRTVFAGGGGWPLAGR